MKTDRPQIENEISTKSSQSRADELEQRLIDFAVRIVKLSANLPGTPAGKHIAYADVVATDPGSRYPRGEDS